MLYGAGVRTSTLALIAFLFTASLPVQAALWPSAVWRVERDLHGPDVELRRRAAQSLRDLPPTSGARLASAALDDADVDVRLAALDACLSLGVAGLGDRLVPWLTDGERRLRLAAAEAISDSPSLRAVPALGRALGDADPAVRGAAATALGKSGAAEAALALLGHLDDAAPEVRKDVALALGDLGDARAVVPLIGKIQDARPIVREAVAQALALLADPRAASALVLALHDTDDSVRIAALGALSKIADSSAVPSVSALLQSGSDAVYSAALETLSQIHDPGATKALIDELVTDRPGNSRAEAVNALSRSGSFSVPALVACLNLDSNPDRLAGCASALGQSRAPEGALAISAALGRGALPALPALLALSDLHGAASLPVVLEYLSDPDLQVRRAARLAAKALLDPRHPDGRAIEPIEHALSVPHVDSSERYELLDLLGQTGSARAAVPLLPYASNGDDVIVRAHALSALGLLGEAGQVPTLLHALDDDSGSVRLSAALALGRLPLAGSTLPLLDRLAHSTERERPILELALAASVSQERDPIVVQRLEELLLRAQGGERDGLIELLGRAPAPAVSEWLAQLSAGPAALADRAKFAESLAGHSSERARLAAMLDDSSALVRANAVWSLGEVGILADRPRLENALRDSDGRVAGNAIEALARILARTHGQVAEFACPRVTDPRPVLRALSLRALRFTGERCAHGEELAALSRDRSDFVRQSAAALLRDVPRDKRDEIALSRARDRDPISAVATECEAFRQSSPEGVDPTVVVVLAPGDDLPRPAQPFALLRADGLVRLGISDRRGQLFELAAPHGALSLLETRADLE
jgi:HEAT repeat protein